MANKIVQTRLFLQQVIDLNIYLETHWNLAVAKRFTAKLTRVIFIIAARPGIGSFSKHKAMYVKCWLQNTTESITG